MAIKFIDSDVNFQEWFDDVIGVTMPVSNVEEILIKVSNTRYGYIKTKPLHPSQTELKEMKTDEYVFIMLKVKVNKELITTIISFGADVEVLKPLSLRKTVKDIAEQLYKQYRDG